SLSSSSVASFGTAIVLPVVESRISTDGCQPSLGLLTPFSCRTNVGPPFATAISFPSGEQAIVRTLKPVVKCRAASRAGAVTWPAAGAAGPSSARTQHAVEITIAARKTVDLIDGLRELAVIQSVQRTP